MSAVIQLNLVQQITDYFDNMTIEVFNNATFF